MGVMKNICSENSEKQLRNHASAVFDSVTGSFLEFFLKSSKYLFVRNSNRDTRKRREVCSRLTIKTPERRFS